jgi:VanZ family protein
MIVEKIKNTISKHGIFCHNEQKGGFARTEHPTPPNSPSLGKIAPMPAKKVTFLSESALGILLWVLVAGYTYILPNFRIVYQAIFDAYGLEVVGKVPLAIVAAFGAAYVLAVLRTRKDLKNLLYLLPAALIAYIIMRLEPNPNKHIHIPQYTLMAWLLYAALSRGYKGKGLYLLIFISGSLLGVVDELEQGIHPARFYGWSDMLVNSASSVVGIFTLLGLKPAREGDWSWVGYLKEHRGLIGLGSFGLVCAGIMCYFLFRVQAAEKFWGVYPVWLLVWNLAYLILAPVLIFLDLRRQKSNEAVAGDSPAVEASSASGTARLWIYPLLAILFYMHALLVFVSFTGMEFR